MNKKLLICASLLSFSIQANAAEVDMNMAEMQAMDKITGRVSIIDVPVNGAVSFGSFSVLVRSCKARTSRCRLCFRSRHHRRAIPCLSACFFENIRQIHLSFDTLSICLILEH